MKKSVSGILRSLFALILALAVYLQPAAVIESNAGEGYHIYINIVANVVTVYYDGVPVRAMITSTGTDTPLSGTYNISQKFDWGYLNGNVYGQYCTRIYKGILFHSVPYIKAYDRSSLKHGQYDLLGTAASMGCMRLCVADAKWIYDNIPMNTPVTFYSDETVASPLGMPFAAKIEGFGPVLAGWDPTDPYASNPWNAYLGAAFDAQYYLEHNPDLQSSGYFWTDESLKQHWLACGIKEGRRASAAFSINDYKRQMNYRFGADNYAYVANYNNTASPMIAVASSQTTATTASTAAASTTTAAPAQTTASTAPAAAPAAQQTAPASTGSSGNAFNAIAYADRYPDVKAMYGYNALALWNHYVTVGIYEGRIAY